MNFDREILPLFQESHHYKFLLQKLSEGIVFHAEDKSIQFANNAAIESLGHTLEQLEGKAPNAEWKIIKEDGTEYSTESLPAMIVFETGKEVINQVIGIYNTKNNEIKWFKVNAYPLRKKDNENGYGVFATFSKFTQEKKSQTLEKTISDKLQRAYIDLQQRQFAIDQHSIIAVTDLSGKIIYVNEKFCKISKFSEQELLGENHRIINSDYHARFFFEELYKTIYAGKIWHGEIRNKTKNGEIYWVDTTIVPLQDEKGALEQFIAIMTDITIQKNIQEELRFSEAKIRVLLESNTQAIIFLDSNKKIQFFNNVANRNSLLVFNRELAYGESIHKSILPEDIDSFDAAFKISLNGSVFTLEKPVNINNEDYWFELQFAPVKNEKDLIIGVLFTVNDINDRKQLHRELAQSELRFRTIFDQAPMGIALANSYSGIPVQVNQKFCEILGSDSDELTNIEFLNFIFPGDKEFYEENMNRLNSGKIKLFAIELRFIKKDGSLIWTHVTCVPLWNKDDKIRLNIRILIDITHRKKNEEELNQNLKELENLNNTKDKFFNIIAHDLRNPFSGIMGIAELLENQVMSDNSEFAEYLIKYLKMIQTSSKSAYNLLENLMQWAKSQTGEIRINAREIYLKNLVDASINIISSNAFQKNISVECEILSDEKVFADESIVNTILRNLLTNAIKFSYPNGKVIVSSNAKGEFLEISISDFGVGIAPNNIEKLFRIDSKFINPGTKNEKGTGLGLILCKEFTELHGGEIRVKSEIGKGSTFTFTLPKENF
ncbi:MAG: PAS domain S-box protein [Leptospiraceae bacterium]|nr:PAS domain S-box protein [Leptospiraceae bacterium]MBK9498282.1 PAS domain S-box protein [Leptospiraceae bacterium]MBL0262949.1 PAS domain S-box protein [Leptospiraceae bacterium]MBP9162456.1 PAS domain S-box protein [Leptospiraceae bacterium]